MTIPVDINVAGVQYTGTVQDSQIPDLVCAGLRAALLNTVPRSEETKATARQRVFVELLSGERASGAAQGSRLRSVLATLGVDYDSALAQLLATGLSESAAQKALRSHPSVLELWPLETKTAPAVNAIFTNASSGSEEQPA